MYYLVEINMGSLLFKKFLRFFKKHNPDGSSITDYCFAGFVKGNEDDGDNEGKDIYTYTDREEDYPEAEIISVEEWAARFPEEGNLTTLPKFYLVELDRDSPIYQDFRHFAVDQDEDDEYTLRGYEYAGITESGWVVTDEHYDYPECDIITLEEWKQLRKPNFEAW